MDLFLSWGWVVAGGGGGGDSFMLNSDCVNISFVFHPGGNRFVS